MPITHEQVVAAVDHHLEWWKDEPTSEHIEEQRAAIREEIIAYGDALAERLNAIPMDERPKPRWWQR